jgi:hypothetical protein
MHPRKLWIKLDITLVWNVQSLIKTVIISDYPDLLLPVTHSIWSGSHLLSDPESLYALPKLSWGKLNLGIG